MALTIGEIAAKLPKAEVIGDPKVAVRGICYDSRRCEAGDLFVAVRGFVSDGHDYAADAARRGAAAVLAERRLDLALPQVIVDDSRRAMGLAAAHFYGDPSHRLRVIGVTGTNGKTTTTYMVRSLLRAAGRKVGLIGTIEQSIDGEAIEASRTTPESVDLQRLFAAMVEKGCAAAVMEVSSHGLALGRTTGTEFDVAVFTNLTQDHFDFHRDMEDYLNAKALLFRSLGEGSPVKTGKCAVINGDDPHAPRFAQASAAPVVTYGLGDGCDFRAVSVRIASGGVEYTAVTPQGRVPVRLRLTGRFNVYNSLAALAVAHSEGIDLEAAAPALEETVVPGRFEPVRKGQDFSVIIDYAHTPDGLVNVLETARDIAAGRVICVVGAGGDRDRAKRPLMGEVAARLADIVIVTSDNPRSEDPLAICEEVAEGARRAGGAFEVVVDRREAIRNAVRAAKAGDLVLIAGKGHETYQEVKGVKFPFDDRVEAAKALEEILTHGSH